MKSALDAIYIPFNHTGHNTATGSTASPHDAGILLKAAAAILAGSGNISVRRPLRPLYCVHVPIHGALERE